MPFTNAYHGPGDRQPVDLAARIDAELRARIEDAVDYACLGAMVAARRAHGGAAPDADDPGDREEYVARVQAFLERLRGEIAGALGDGAQRRLGPAIAAPPTGNLSAAITVQVALAKELPDYWQRFEAVRLSAAEARPPSSRSSRLLDRLLGRG